jgi:hypothetical protein
VPKQKKTDNRSLRLKIEIRTKALAAAGLTHVRVLDLCAGEGDIWREMRKHVDVTSYVPVDRKPRAFGSIKGEALTIARAIDLTMFDVIDVDTYGSPWEIWLNLAQRIRSREVVCLTHGTTSQGGGDISKFEMKILGIPRDWDIPNGPGIPRMAAQYALQAGLHDNDLDLIAGYRVDLQNVSYYALAVEPHLPEVQVV